MFYREILKQNPLFSCLADFELDIVSEIAKAESYPKGRFSLREGETSTSLYIVLSGRANAIAYNHRDEKIILNTFLRGDYFGEMSFIDGEPRCASVETDQYTEVLIIPREEFRSLFARRPQISDILMKGLLQKIRRATTEVNHLIEVISNQELHDAHLEIIDRLVLAAEYKDECTGGHISRIGRYSRLIAEKIGLSSESIENVRNAAPMHDIGKIGIPEIILLKPSKLTDEEFDIIKKHTTIGGNILSNPRSELLKCAKRIAMSHHEKFNGSGYPNAFKGLEIPVEGRIVAIVDAFDAITSERPYKKALSTDEAVSRIKKDRGSHFDPEITDVFLDNIDKIETIKESLEKDHPDSQDPDDACKEPDSHSDE